MTRIVTRAPLPITAAEFLSPEFGLPEKVELIEGVVGPYSNVAKIALLSNWGADAIVRLTGPEIWLEAIAAAKRQT